MARKKQKKADQLTQHELTAAAAAEALETIQLAPWNDGANYDVWQFNPTQYRWVQRQRSITELYALFDRLCMQHSEWHRPSQLSRRMFISELMDRSDNQFKPIHMVRVPGGILDTHTGAMQHTQTGPADRLVMSYAATPRPTPTPVFDRFLAELANGRAGFKTYLMHQLRVILTPLANQPSDVEKIFVFFGPPGSGKSTLLDLIEGLVGSTNVGEFSDVELQNERGAASLIGRTVGLCHEGGGMSGDADRLKRLISNQPVLFRQLFRDGQRRRLNVRLVMACNELPTFGEVDVSGMARRTLLTTIQEPAEPPNPGLLGQLQLERDGIMHRIFQIPLADAQETCRTRTRDWENETWLEALDQQFPVAAIVNELWPNGFMKRTTEEITKKVNQRLASEAYPMRSRKGIAQQMNQYCRARKWRARQIWTKSRQYELREGETVKIAYWTYDPPPS